MLAIKIILTIFFGFASLFNLAISLDEDITRGAKTIALALSLLNVLGIVMTWL